MTSASDGIGRLQLRYFGQVSASISHELKNVLAILNENAGLLQDYAAMAEQGQALDLQRIRRLADTLQAQVQRGDAIVRRMNRFAHSTDQLHASVDVVALVQLVCDLFARTAASRGVTVALKATVGEQVLFTDPVALETLLGGMLDCLTAHQPQAAELLIELDRQAKGLRIRISGAAQPLNETALCTEEIERLVALLRAGLALEATGDGLVLTLPASIAP